MDEVGGAGYVGDAPVSVVQQVGDGFPDARVLLPEPDPGHGCGGVRRAEQDGGQAETLEESGARVVGAGVGQHGAVDAAFGGEPFVQCALLGHVGDQVEQQAVAPGASWPSRPVMSSLKWGSAPRTSVGRRTTSAIVRVLALRSAVAGALGDQPSSAAAARTRRRVASDIRPVSLTAWETVAVETPAAAATALMVGRVPLPGALRPGRPSRRSFTSSPPH